MASNSTLVKPMQESNLSKCVTTVLLMCCYLYHKRVLQHRFQSYQLAYQLSYESKAHNLGNNVNAKGNKDEVEMQTPSTTPIFLPRYRKALKLPPVLVGAPRKESLARAKLPVG
jgi:hypothetical protein